MHRILSVVVHGASGTQGAVVARRLVADGHRVVGVVRNPPVRGLTDDVPRVVADLRDVPALIRAYVGVDAVVVHLPGGSPDDAALPEAVAVLTALRAAGVPRAVFNTGGAVWDRPTGVPTLDARTALAVGLPGSVPIATVIGSAAAYMENLSAPWATAQLTTEGVLVGHAAFNWNWAATAAEPPRRRVWARRRRSRRFPSHTKGVGWAFHPVAVSSNHVMRSCGVVGSWPASARRTIMRWTDSAMLSHDPERGVYKGSTPCATNQRRMPEDR